MAVVLVAALHLADDDVPYANLGGIILERRDPMLCCHNWMGWEVQASCGCTSGHIELPVDL